jgi:hypothetical protein
LELVILKDEKENVTARFALLAMRLNAVVPFGPVGLVRGRAARWAPDDFREYVAGRHAQ